MPITINGTGTIAGISVGGLDDGIITGAELNGAQTGSAPIYGCRAWVNFSGSSGSIRASGNVSSVSRTNTGRYTINFSTAMPDANYIAHFSHSSNSGWITSAPVFFNNGVSAPGTSSFVVEAQVSGSLTDPTYACVSVFR